jgi:hypothetical protein
MFRSGEVRLLARRAHATVVVVHAELTFFVLMLHGYCIVKNVVYYFYYPCSHTHSSMTLWTP